MGKEILSELDYLKVQKKLLINRVNELNTLLLKNKGALEMINSMIEIRTEELKEKKGKEEDHEKSES